MNDAFMTALREKYREPKDVMRVLGLDEALLREDDKETMDKKEKAGRAAMASMLAQDASLAEMTEFLKALNASGSEGAAVEEGFEDHEDEDEDEDDGEDEIPGAVTENNSGVPELGEGEEDDEHDEVATDGPVGKLHAILKGKLSPEELAEVGECLEQIAGGDDAEEGDEEDEHEPDAGIAEKHEGEDEDEDSEEGNAEGEDEDEEDDDMNKDLVTKPAMDAAIQSAVAAERERAKEVEEAKIAVRPWVGDLRMAFDSGAAVYRKALSLLNVEGADKVKDPDALPILLKLTPRPGQPTAPVREVSLGMDSAASDSFSKMFPGIGRVELAY